jgi:hypothetical protein
MRHRTEEAALAREECVFWSRMKASARSIVLVRRRCTSMQRAGPWWLLLTTNDTGIQVIQNRTGKQLTVTNEQDDLIILKTAVLTQDKLKTTSTSTLSRANKLDSKRYKCKPILSPAAVIPPLSAYGESP